MEGLGATDDGFWCTRNGAVFPAAAVTTPVERTFLVVRVVRGSLLLVFLIVAAVAVELKGWPRGVTVAVVVAALLLAGRLVSDLRRLGRGSSSDAE